MTETAPLSHFAPFAASIFFYLLSARSRNTSYTDLVLLQCLQLKTVLATSAQKEAVG